MDGATDIKAFPRTSLVERSILPVVEKRKEKPGADIGGGYSVPREAYPSSPRDDVIDAAGEEA
jgi:hypothetical protein